MTTPTVAEVVVRIRELVHAITQGRESLLREFTMRVPADPKRDADLVLSTAASLLESEHAARVEAERERDELDEAHSLAAEALNQTHEALMEWEGHACGGDCLAEPCSNCDGKGKRAGKGQQMAEQIEELTERAETAERELAALRNRPCPYVHSSGEGTHYCTLPNLVERERDELRKRMAEAPRVTFRLGYAEGLFEVDSAQEDHLVPTGQRVAILPLREGE